jgi:hypothetical protein
MNPKEKPYQAEQGGWLGLFDDLDPLIDLAFKPNADKNSILTDGENGFFVWSDCTIEKLKQSNIAGTLEDKQMKLVCHMFDLTYSLMMDKRDAIVNGTPFVQFIGPSY